MENDKSVLLVRLIPLNERTRDAWRDPHNAQYFLPSSYQGSEPGERSIRETTPCGDDVENEASKGDSEPELRLKLEDLPKDVAEGFVFGRTKPVCDIYCGALSRGFNISGRAFSIAINKECQMVLKYLTDKSEISVQYGHQDPGVRRVFTWILFNGCKNDIIVKVAEQLQFCVIVPELKTHTVQYREACREYATNVESAVAAIPVLCLDSQPVTHDPSHLHTANARPFYYRSVGEELGSGSSGRVYVVYDASTGEKYAGKEFHGGQVDHYECQTLAKQNHPYIVKYIDFTREGGGPLLVMEHVRFGNLARAWRDKDEDMWSVMEITRILYQCLHAFEYLHAKPIVVHRDINPRSIMIQDRYPSPRIKIGNFGNAKEGMKANGKVGSWTYAAPEVFSDGFHTPAVDMWSLGVVVLQMLMKGDLPEPKSKVAYGPSWCKNIEDFVAGQVVDMKQAVEESKVEDSPVGDGEIELWSFLKTHMLRADLRLRSSAKECLEAGRYTVFGFYYDGDEEEDDEEEE